MGKRVDSCECGGGGGAEAQAGGAMGIFKLVAQFRYREIELKVLNCNHRRKGMSQL